MKQNKKTIGSQSDKLAKEYFEMYDKMKNDSFYKNLNIETLAETDLIFQKVIFEFAIEKLRKMIQKDKNQCKTCGKEMKTYSINELWCRDETCPNNGVVIEVQSCQK